MSKEKVKYFELRKLFTPSVIFLIAANLLPFYGVLYLEWKVFPILLLFWIENVIIGVFNILKMIFSEPENLLKWIAKLFMVPFFSFHYGMFTAIHGIFVLALFGNQEPGAPNEILDSVLPIIFEYKLFYAVFGLIISHGFSFIWNYIGKGEYKSAKIQELMGKPYGRVVVLHVTIIFGGFLLMALKSPEAGLLILLILKIFIDIKAHLREHNNKA